ncbi:IQ and AAA domain-containing protein 1-like [Protopterus annectens]|uniref:IQ and AAA domain-containing protein 1-like n=1 Tax=Protopterus annectens TaxID=7888 RepID=UPI001CFC2DBF|nr:IQ and AAA domain-containing protein 1-like [Protopterus annectens]
MSHRTYNKMWASAQTSINDLLVQEMPQEPRKPERDRVVFFQMLATLYVRYIQIFRKLETAYDQIVHPQKRRILRLVLDGVMGRILELKNEMVEKEFSEYHYMDDVIQDCKLTPEDLEIPIPKYFLRERKNALEERRKLLNTVLSKLGPKDLTKGKPPKPMLLEEAIKIIQKAERFRQGRLRARFMRDIRREEEWERRSKDRQITAADHERATITIQRIWRGCMQRKKTKQERDDEMIFIGMVPEPQSEKSSPVILKAKEAEVKRRVIQEEHEAEYGQAQGVIKEKLLEAEGMNIKETMKEQIRQWFIECHHATGHFPDYPDEEDGGSALIFAEKTPEQLQEELAAKEAEKENKSGKKKGAKEEKKKKEDKKGKSKGKGEAVEEVGLKMAPSNFLPDVAEEHKNYTAIWKKRDESKNFRQAYDAELIKEDKRKEVEREIRVQVDELMREELRNLKLAVDRDRGIKTKKGKKSAKKKKKKGKKSGKKKKEKDLTPGRTIDSLYEELISEGLIKAPENVQLSDYIGEYSYLGTTLRQYDIEPMPSLFDVRHVITLHAILPLGSAEVRKKAPLFKTLLLAGPAGVGKKTLVHAICTEAGANLFDISPQNIAGKYPGKNGLQLMLFMVFKVAREMQPSVIWIGDAEKIFYKKVPREEKELDPKRLKASLPKILKSIKAEDQILIVGTTERPFEADIKPFCKVYEKIILIPRPDYSSRYVIWKSLIKRYGGVVTPALDFSSLAKISDGYTQGRIVDVVKSVLTERRIEMLPKKPLKTVEFLAPLAKVDPIFKEEEEELKNWYSKTPLGKKRARAALGKEGEEEEQKKGAGKDGKKNKK